MGMYIKGYIQRATMLIVTVVMILASLLLCYGLFQGKLNKVSGQLDRYTSADYSIIYILNYGKAFKNECLYPDTDIQIFLDAGKACRLTVSCVMKEERVFYDLDYLKPLLSLKTNEICISQNIADTYKIGINDIVYAEYSYTSKLIPLKVASIMGVEFDYEYPLIDNAIGMVFLGYNEQYINNIKGKYILFADQSQADVFSEYPQIINTIINKTVNEDTVLYQGFPALVFEGFFTTATLILVQIIFFSKSFALLYRCYLKGIKRSLMIVFPLIERILFCLLPCAIMQWLITMSMPGSIITTVYRVLPMCIFALFCVIMVIIEALRLRRKGG